MYLIRAFYLDTLKRKEPDHQVTVFPMAGFLHGSPGGLTNKESIVSQSESERNRTRQ